MRAAHLTRKYRSNYECSLCDYEARTRYGFRAHMLDIHNYKSKGHARPGLGMGRRNRRAEGSL